ncbi:MAG TPA: hypothetical protein VD929_06655 [Caulobacteraceae bacterium]|nr:hypothetical protein [Caulobacteraceae bacterium]
MKIGPPAPPQPTPFGRAPEAPTEGFAALLGGMEGGGSDRAFAYDELGVLGARPAPVATPPVAPMPTPWRAPFENAAAPVLRTPASADVTAPVRPRAAAPGPVRADAAPRRDAALETPFLARTRADAEPPPLRQMQRLERRAAASRPDAQARLHQRLERLFHAHAPLRLAVHERDGAVQLAVGTSGADPDEALRLRRAAEALLAEFGLSLSTFTLDGRPVANPFRGAEHGR